MEEKGINLIPLDVISHILSLLPIEDILRCGTVCREWYTLTKDPYFINLQFRATALQHNRFIFIPKSSRNIYLLNTEGRNVREISLSTIIPGRWGMSPIDITGSCHGFLCITSLIYPHPMLVFNPITKELVELPLVVPSIHRFIHAALGYDPSSAKYKVVKVYKNKTSKLSSGHILTLGETSWRRFDFPYRLLSSISALPVYCQGRLYWMIEESARCHDDKIIQFMDLSTEEFYIITDLRPLPRQLSPYNISLVREGNNVTINVYKDSWGHFWNIWRNRDGTFSGRYFKCPCNTKTNWRALSRRVFIGKMDDCHLLETSMHGKHKRRHLVLYCPRRELYLRSKIRGLPQWFRSLTLQPNLLSPRVFAVGAMRQGRRNTVNT